jgi:hypothetical protein
VLEVTHGILKQLWQDIGREEVEVISDCLERKWSDFEKSMCSAADKFYQTL